MLFISPVNAVLVPFDPTGASQPLDVQGINTHRHVRHPSNDRVLHFLRRFIRSITDGPQEGSSVEKKGKGKNRKAGFPSWQAEIGLQTPASASGCRARVGGENVERTYIVSRRRPSCWIESWLDPTRFERMVVDRRQIDADAKKWLGGPLGGELRYLRLSLV